LPPKETKRIPDFAYGINFLYLSKDGYPYLVWIWGDERVTFDFGIVILKEGIFHVF